MTFLQEIRETMQPKPGVTEYLRRAAMVYLIIAATWESCTCISQYETNLISEDVASAVLNTVDSGEIYLPQ